MEIGRLEILYVLNFLICVLKFGKFNLGWTRTLKSCQNHSVREATWRVWGFRV